MRAKFVDRKVLFEALHKDVKVQRFGLLKDSSKKERKEGSPTYSVQWRKLSEILKGRDRIVKIDKRDVKWEGARTCKVRFLVENGVLKYPRFKIRKINV